MWGHPCWPGEQAQGKGPSCGCRAEQEPFGVNVGPLPEVGWNVGGVPMTHRRYSGSPGAPGCPSALEPGVL